MVLQANRYGQLIKTTYHEKPFTFYYRNLDAFVNGTEI